MTEVDLVTIAVRRFFSPHELAIAQKSYDEQGADKATSVLVEFVATRPRGMFGQAVPTVDVWGNYVLIRFPGRVTGEPDVIVPLGEFCREAVLQLKQPRLL